ncbi:MAG: hypothetical protein ACFNVM_00430 [Neisseria elongata]
MIVIATKDGFYGSLRRAGDEFEVEDGLEASWFEPKEPVSAEGDGEESAKGSKAKGAGKQS